MFLVLIDKLIFIADYVTSLLPSIIKNIQKKICLKNLLALEAIVPAQKSSR